MQLRIIQKKGKYYPQYRGWLRWWTIVSYAYGQPVHGVEDEIAAKHILSEYKHRKLSEAQPKKVIYKEEV